MACELPRFNKCCCCLPLRGGLLGYGYLHLVSTVLLTLYYVCTLFFVTYMPDSVSSVYATEATIMYSIMIAVMIIDLLFIISFIYGAHAKHYKSVRVYYYYTLTSIVLTTAIVTVFFGRNMYFISQMDDIETEDRKELFAIAISVYTDLAMRYSGMFFLHLYLAFQIRSLFVKFQEDQRSDEVSRNSEELPKYTTSLYPNLQVLYNQPFSYEKSNDFQYKLVQA